jgi:hypothetical protein
MFLAASLGLSWAWNYAVVPAFDGVHSIESGQALVFLLVLCGLFRASLWYARAYVRELAAAELAYNNLQRDAAVQHGSVMHEAHDGTAISTTAPQGSISYEELHQKRK